MHTIVLSPGSAPPYLYRKQIKAMLHYTAVCYILNSTIQPLLSARLTVRFPAAELSVW